MKRSGRNPNSRSDPDSATILEQWEAAFGISRLSTVNKPGGLSAPWLLLPVLALAQLKCPSDNCRVFPRVVGTPATPASHQHLCGN
jgi:hypothetical protein